MGAGKLSLLFLSTRDSARGPIASAMALAGGRDGVASMSAGISPAPIDALTVRVMSEIGIDLASHQGIDVALCADREFDCLITVSERARVHGPGLVKAHTLVHWSFDDLVAANGTDEHRLEVFRRVRNEIRNRVRLFLLEWAIRDWSVRLGLHSDASEDRS